LDLQLAGMAGTALREVGMDDARFGEATGPLFLIFTSREHPPASVQLVGDLDLTVVACLLNWARAFAARPVPAVRVDLSGLKFADVAGLRALAEACCLLRRSGCLIDITAQSESVRRLTALTGIAIPADSGRIGGGVAARITH
jgi:anti-anti-sigma factor